MVTGSSNKKVTLVNILILVKKINGFEMNTKGGLYPISLFMKVR